MNVLCEIDVDKVTLTAPVRHLCPFRDEADEGEVEFTIWLGMGKAPELHSLREWLDEWAERKISHEDFTTEVAAGLWKALDPAHIKTVTRWRTAGIAVEIEVQR